MKKRSLFSALIICLLVATALFFVVADSVSGESVTTTVSGTDSISFEVIYIVYELPTFIPPTPSGLTPHQNNFWVNYSWSAGSGVNITNSYNVSHNTGWSNNSIPFRNNTVGPHGWSNISVYAYNNSGTGQLNLTPATMNTQVANNVPFLDTIGPRTVTVGQLLTFTISAIDADSDTLTNATNASKGTFIPSTGVFTWTPGDGDAGTYQWSFNTSDMYGGVDSATITVTVNPAPSIIGFAPPSPVIDTQGATRVFNVTVSQTMNVTWYINGTQVGFNESVTSANYTNTSAALGIWNVSAAAVNENGSAMQTWIWDVSSSTTVPVISFIDPTPPNGATFTQNFVNINTTISNSANTTAFIDWNGSLAGWWRFNGESGESPTFFLDWSNRGNNGTCSGSSCPVPASGKFGNGLSFDGVNDYISAGNNVTITAPYSIEGWVKIPTNRNSANKNIISLGTTSNDYPKFSPYKGTTNKPLIYLGSSNYRYGSTNLADNKWHHIAFIVMGTNAADILNAKIYVDGVEEVYGTTRSTSMPVAPSGNAWIGTNSFKGSIDEIRIQNRALNTEEIKTSYDAGVYGLSRNFANLAFGVYNFKANVQNLDGIINQTQTRTVTLERPPVSIIDFTDPTPPDGSTLTENFVNINTTISNSANTTAFIDWNGSLAGWWRFNGESGESPTFFIDWSSRGNNGTCSGSSCPVSASGKFGNGLRFDGVNDYITAGNNATITAPYSIEGWVKIPTNPGSANRAMMSLGTTSSGYPKFSPHKGTTNKPMIYLDASNYRYGSTNLADNNWHHIAFIVTGTNAADIINAKIYVDGVEEVYSTTRSTSMPVAPSGKAWIGTNSFNGTLDEMRIQNRALNPEEIKASYDAGIYGLSGNFAYLEVGVYNFKANVQNLNGITNQTEIRTVTLELPPASIINFTDPTPADGATLTENYVYINTTISNSENTTAFIDWNGSITAWWRFNRESGESPAFFMDWSRRGNNGTCSGTLCPVSASGKFGNGLSFDGVNDYITAGNNVTITAPYSIEGWVKIPANSGSANKNIISLGTTSSGYPKFSPHKGTTNKPMIYLNASNYRYGSTNLADNNWHHIAFIVTGTNAADIINAKIYVDGVEEVYGSTVRTGLPAAPSGKAWIGTNSFNGTLDEIRVQNRALNTDEIKASFNAGVYGLNQTFTNLGFGAYNYRAYAQNLYGIVNKTEERTLII